MKLEVGKWYKDRGGMRWHVDWVGEQWACGHNSSGVCMCWRSDGNYYNGLEDHRDLVSEWTEPKLRPWKHEEVPLGTWMREKKHGLPSLIVAILSTGIIRGHGDTIPLDYALAHYEYSTDIGKTWLPCGVLEGGK